MAARYLGKLAKARRGKNFTQVASETKNIKTLMRIKPNENNTK